MGSCVLSSCCCGCSLRIGILIYIYIKLAVFVCYIVLVMIGTQVVGEALRRFPDDPKVQEASAEIHNAGIILGVGVVLLPFELCGLIGAHKGNVRLIKIYYYSSFVFLVLGLILELFRQSSTDIRLRIIVFILDLALSIYMFIVVKSEINRLTSKTKPDSIEAPSNYEKIKQEDIHCPN